MFFWFDFDFLDLGREQLEIEIWRWVSSVLCSGLRDLELGFLPVSSLVILSSSISSPAMLRSFSMNSSMNCFGVLDGFLFLFFLFDG